MNRIVYWCDTCDKSILDVREEMPCLDLTVIATVRCHGQQTSVRTTLYAMMAAVGSEFVIHTFRRPQQLSFPFMDR